MRVAIDATPLTLSSGGLRRYTEELSLALACNFSGDEYFLVSDQPFAMPAGAPANLRRGGSPRNAAERRWWVWGLNRELDRLGADVFHGSDFAVPYWPKRPSVLMLHDLSPWMDPAWHSGAGRVRLRTPLLIRFGAATMIVTPSEAVRRQAIEHFGIHPDRIRAVPLAASAGFRPVTSTAGAAPYFLYAAALEPRKNIDGLISAWSEVRKVHAVDLMVAGKPRADFRIPAPQPGLQMLGEVPDQRLAELYSGALAVVYPSFYEGFGLPVLEAMQCGACVITSRDAALQELGADATIRTGSPTELIAAMMELAERPERAVAWRACAIERAAGFSWDRSAQATHAVFEAAQRRF